MWETWVRSLSWEDPLEEDMATHSRILAWRILWTEEPGGPRSIGPQRIRHNWSALALMHYLNVIPGVASAILLAKWKWGKWKEGNRAKKITEKWEHSGNMMPGVTLPLDLWLWEVVYYNYTIQVNLSWLFYYF